MCGGDEAAYSRAGSFDGLLWCTGDSYGPAGAGQLTKMVNQICIAGLVQGLSEALNFGQNAGLDMDKVLGVVSGGAAQSWQMENRTTMVRDEFDFGFAVDWMRKDLRIFVWLKPARTDRNCPLPLWWPSFMPPCLRAASGAMIL